MTPHPTRHRGRRRAEPGMAVTVWAALLVTVLVALIGITVDLTGQVNSKQRAYDLAQQAGRAAANQALISQAMQGQTPDLDPAAASDAATGYLNAAGVTGTVTLTGPNTLAVTVTTVYQPTFAGAFGVGAQTMTGRATVDLARVVNGVEQ